MTTIATILSAYGFETRANSFFWGVGTLVWGIPPMLKRWATTFMKLLFPIGLMMTVWTQFKTRKRPGSFMVPKPSRGFLKKCLLPFGAIGKKASLFLDVQHLKRLLDFNFILCYTIHVERKKGGAKMETPPG